MACGSRPSLPSAFHRRPFTAVAVSCPPRYQWESGALVGSIVIWLSHPSVWSIFSGSQPEICVTGLINADISSDFSGAWRISSYGFAKYYSVLAVGLNLFSEFEQGLSFNSSIEMQWKGLIPAFPQNFHSLETALGSGQTLWRMSMLVERNSQNV